MTSLSCHVKGEVDKASLLLAGPVQGLKFAGQCTP